MDPMKLRALEQVKACGRRGQMVERGWESITQMQLVEDGHVWQEAAGRRAWKLTLSPSGERMLDDSLSSSTREKP